MSIKIEIGDRVRSYDFPTNDTCYVEGEVIGIGDFGKDCDRYEIKPDRIVWDGKDITKFSIRPLHNVYPPVNGTPKSTGGFVRNVVPAPKIKVETIREGSTTRYMIVGFPEEVEAKIAEIKRDYHPCGYGTFVASREPAGNGIEVAVVKRSNSCD